MGLLQRLLNNEKGVTSVEVAFATPMLAILALSCVEVTSFILFQQKLDRATTAMGDLTAQARGLTNDDLANLYDAAEYIMRPFDLDNEGSVIVSSISTDDDENPRVNWQWNSSDSASQFGVANGAASLPEGFVVRDGESIVVSEVYAMYTPIVMGRFFDTNTFYQYSIFRPRFDALTSLD
ncbi:TadE/TadG family type IV pilus assembly protein [Terasakiella sp. A23]|uniref:TadE/TadG family type IV pilus assembly protein n=1 Tax=Terasakiella sp. FCG-A23 TaxID=3080561 RepID=UPI002953889C|nr:TadE/TadG family type IV pilus assembly protein [Terasakiella sp. A23]MDV7340381.1 TadE/TadG family type IV pilus assembly protein [Terasakiella sp. A23]